MTKTRGWRIPEHTHKELISRIEKKVKSSSSKSDINDVLYKHYQATINNNETNPLNKKIEFKFTPSTFKDLKYRKDFSASYKIAPYNVLTHFLEKSFFIDWSKNNRLAQPTKANNTEDLSIKPYKQKTKIIPPKTKGKKEDIPLGKYDFYFTETTEPKTGLNFSADYELRSESGSSTFRDLKSSRVFEGETPVNMHGNVFYEFTSDSAELEKVYLIFRVGADPGKDYLPGLYLAANKNLHPVCGPALLVKKGKDKDKKNVESFFAHYKFLKTEIITGINLDDAKGTLAKYNKLKILCGSWKVMRWNDREELYSIYSLTITDNLEVICKTRSFDFQCSINVIGNNRIIIEGLNNNKDTMIIFTARFTAADKWGKRESFHATYKRTSPDNIRYGDCIFIKTNKRFRATRSKYNQLSSKEKIMAEPLKKKSYLMQSK